MDDISTIQLYLPIYILYSKKSIVDYEEVGHPMYEMDLNSNESYNSFLTIETYRIPEMQVDNLDVYPRYVFI